MSQLLMGDITNDFGGKMRSSDLICYGGSLEEVVLP